MHQHTSALATLDTYTSHKTPRALPHSPTAVPQHSVKNHAGLTLGGGLNTPTTIAWSRS